MLLVLLLPVLLAVASPILLIIPCSRTAAVPHVNLPP